MDTNIILPPQPNKMPPVFDGWDLPSDYHFMDEVYVHQVNFPDRITRYTNLHPSFGYYLETVARFTVRPKSIHHNQNHSA